jgi:hypothetical protein
LSSTDTTTPVPPPGWYANPSGPGQRYWDGEKWTDSYSQTQPTQAPPVVNETTSSPGLVVAGYVFAVLIPIVGFALGIVVATRPDKRTSKHGVWIIVLSVVVVIVYVAIVAGSSGGSTSSGG